MNGPTIQASPFTEQNDLNKLTFISATLYLIAGILSISGAIIAFYVAYKNMQKPGQLSLSDFAVVR